MTISELNVNEIELIKTIREAPDNASRESLTQKLKKLAHFFNTTFDDGRKYERSLRTTN